MMNEYLGEMSKLCQFEEVDEVEKFNEISLAAENSEE